MRRTKIFLLSGLCALFFATAANAQELINQATEFFNKGVEAVRANDWATAINQLNQAINIAKDLDEEGQDIVADAQGLIPNLHLRLGQELAQAAKTEEAIVQLNKAVDTALEYDDPGATAKNAKDLIDQLNLRTATSLLNDRKYEEAIAAFEKVLEATPNNGVVHMYVGAAYAALNKEGEAIAAYEKAIELGSRDAATRLANIYLTSAQTANRDRKWTDMYDLAHKALVLAPENANAVRFVGISAFELKKYDEAVLALEKTLAANPNASDKNGTIFRLAQATEAQGKNSQACGYYKQLVGDATFKDFAEHKIKNVLRCP